MILLHSCSRSMIKIVQWAIVYCMLYVYIKYHKLALYRFFFWALFTICFCVIITSQFFSSGFYFMRKAVSAKTWWSGVKCTLKAFKIFRLSHCSYSPTQLLIGERCVLWSVMEGGGFEVSDGLPATGSFWCKHSVEQSLWFAFEHCHLTLCSDTQIHTHIKQLLAFLTLLCLWNSQEIQDWQTPID